ncbi:dinucleotide-binding enzyme [Cenarchaeum symbiosum A]|uniref:Dinucleotide-binding enzyme n=1 Tax=Cenarchaeum symbiosum (strain A) TaxID=414004 RepID=A0RZ15_CENSY|nr:dinucleotide-binding enzyme [Cenarchaeum symbiosum A]
MGRGFALRWCKNHEVLVGSRDAARAEEAAKEYAGIAGQGTIRGGSNESIAAESDVLVLSIPYGNIDAVCPTVLAAAREDCVIISPIVPMRKTDAGFEFIPICDGTPPSYDLVAKHVKRREMLVSALHAVSEKKLVDTSRNLDYDVFVCGDGDAAVDTASGLIREMGGLRPLYLGPGSLSYLAEAATPLLLNIMVRNKIKNPGIKIV